MRINGFRCDACCKEHLLESTHLSHSYSEGFPGGWFILSQGAYEPHKEPLLFCSVKCLWDWAEKQITGVREVAPLPEEQTRSSWEW